MDIRLSAVGCLAYDDFLYPKDLSASAREVLSWREANEHLMKQDRTVSEEMEERMLNKSPIGPYLDDRLKFQSIGGLIICDNDADFFILAKSFLIGKYGCQAKLMQVMITRLALQESMKKLAIEAVKKDCTLAICAIHFEDKDRYFVNGKKVECLIRLGHNEFHVKTSDGVTSLVPSDMLSDLKSRLTGKPLTYGHAGWIEVPNILLRQMLKDDWLNA